MYYVITGRRWFQRAYGNTYHSCKVEKVTGTGENYKRETVGYIPFNYGYDDQYRQTAAKILDMEYDDFARDARENREKYVFNVMDVDRKKDL